MKILLVNPVFQPSFWGFQNALRFQGKSCAFPPLGLMTVSAMLPKEWEKRLIDENVKRLKDSDIHWADMVFVTGMLVQKDAIHQVMRRSKALGKIVVLGGPYVSTTEEDILEADHIFVGEAEETLPEFLNELRMGIPQRKYIAAEEKPALELTPRPDFHLINFDDYGAQLIQFSRGCPKGCTFCDIPISTMYGAKPRTKQNGQLLADLESLYLLGYRGPVFIVDDNFIGNKKNVRLLMPDLILWQEVNGFPFSLFTEASIDLAEDIPLLQDMEKASFQRVFIGIETPVEECLVGAHKKQNLKRNMLDSVRIIQDHGMEVMAGFILGFDEEPEDIFDRMISFVQDSGISRAMMGMLQALPGTPLYNQLRAEGRLLSEGVGNIDGHPNFVTKMDRNVLIEGYERVRRTLFSSRAFYGRVLDHFGRMPGPNQEESFMSPLRKLMAATKIIAVIGIWERDRREFWRFIKRTYQEYPDRLGQAFAFAANGYHFRKLLPKS